MKRRPDLVRHEGGAGVVEFALAAPVLFLIIIGVAQLGILFSANAGLSHAVAEGARLAAIYPMPSDEEISDAVLSSEFSLKEANIVADPKIDHKTDANGFPIVEIALSYRVPLDFIFFEAAPLTLTESRTVYTQPAGGSSSSSSSSGGTGSSSSSGGTGGTGGTGDNDGGTSSSSSGGTCKNKNKCG